MGRRTTTILAATDLGATGTKVIEINLKEQMSALYLIWKFTIVTVSVMIGNALKCISKIELVDGAKVMLSVSGRAAQAAAFYASGVMPLNQHSLTVGGIVTAVVPIFFGRALWDELYAFRPDVFDNPQLRITFDEDAANTSTVVNSLAVLAAVDDSPKSGKANGFLFLREHKSYPMAASAVEYTQLPTDYPIRRLFLQGLSTDHDTVTLFGDVKISIENDRVIPIDITFEQLFEMVSARYGPVSENHILDAVVTAKTLFPTTCQDNDIRINYDGTAFVTAQSLFAVATYTGEQIALAASVDIKADTGIVSGYLPHGVLPIDFGDPMDPETWLPVAGISNIRAEIEGSSDADSGDQATIITQQPVLYGQR